MYRLSLRFVEMIHDEMVNLFFGPVEPVSSGQLIREGMLESALAQPFQFVFGRECYPSFPEKATRLMFGIAAAHAFLNGNKRTAVVALDLFCMANEYVLTVDDAELHELAILAASHNQQGIKPDEACAAIQARLEGSALVGFSVIEDPEAIQRCKIARDWLRGHPLNAIAPGAAGSKLNPA